MLTFKNYSDIIMEWTKKSHSTPESALESATRAKNGERSKKRHEDNDPDTVHNAIKQLSYDDHNPEEVDDLLHHFGHKGTFWDQVAVAKNPHVLKNSDLTSKLQNHKLKIVRDAMEKTIAKSSGEIPERKKRTPTEKTSASAPVKKSKKDETPEAKKFRFKLKNIFSVPSNNTSEPEKKVEPEAPKAVEAPKAEKPAKVEPSTKTVEKPEPVKTPETPKVPDETPVKIKPKVTYKNKVMDTENSQFPYISKLQHITHGNTVVGAVTVSKPDNDTGNVKIQSWHGSPNKGWNFLSNHGDEKDAMRHVASHHRQHGDYNPKDDE
jgi:hypothetical protein